MYSVDLTRKPTTTELVDFGDELARIQIATEILKGITNDEFGCRGNCEGIKGKRNPILKDIFKKLSELQNIVEDELERAENNL